jgi:hypothetical protein
MLLFKPFMCPDLIGVPFTRALTIDLVYVTCPHSNIMVMNDDAAFDPKKAMASLAEERDIFDDTPESQGEKILRESIPVVASGLVHLATHAEKETVRVQASREILNRVYGSDKIGGGVDDPLQKWLADVVKESQAAAEAGPEGLDEFRPDA